MKFTTRKLATAGLAILGASGYAYQNNHFIAGSVAGVVGLLAVMPFSIQWVEGRKYVQREKKRVR